MSQDTEDLAARLAALEGTSAKKSGRARPSPMAALLGVGGIAAIGGLAWVALQPAPPAPMPTAAPEEFQTTGTGFGDLAAHAESRKLRLHRQRKPVLRKPSKP